MEEQRKEKGKSAASIFYVRPIKFICNFVFISTEEEIRVEERKGKNREWNGTCRMPLQVYNCVRPTLCLSLEHINKP